ncbi:helix-turn-helix domain-containing protein [Hymenobacter cellulosivorans]|uniref:Helix-turn-helix domain-containing protein n=1 Tax=Hymenobacter cellulosivorans TaxID=2932249 RepID=A0ABY4F508_9BACT|nr:helix-turn-helix domain-containing protein [Hymenobacter cellulosivorans]UOQ51726.1 helix-turn-helix domain-containing protein [Hymenobacter cellulosivorans]
MQTVVIIPEPEWRQVLQRLDKLEQATQAATTSSSAKPDEILNVREAAALLGMKPDGLRKARRAQRIKGVRINEKEWGFRRSELTRYQNRYNRQPLTAAA